MLPFRTLLSLVLRNRSASKHRRLAPERRTYNFSPRLECLEERQLLAVTESQALGVLTISDVGGGNTIVVNSSGGTTPNVLVSVNGGAATSVGTASTVTSIVVSNVGAADTFDLTGVSDATGYTNASLASIGFSDSTGDSLKLGGMQFNAASQPNVAVTATVAAGSLAVDASNGAGLEVGTLALSASAAITLKGNVITTSAATTTQNYSGAVTLNGATSLVSNSATGGGISFSSTVNGPFALSTNSAGTTSFGGAVGNGTALASLTTNGATLTFASNVTTSGAQMYSNVGSITFNGGTFSTTNSAFAVTSASATLTLAANSSSSITTGGGSISIASPVTGSGATLNTTSTGTTTFDGPLSLANLITSGVAGTTELNGGTITASSSLTFNNAVLLTSNAVLSASSSLTFGSTLDGAFALATTAPTTTFNSAVGSFTPLTSLTTNGGTLTLAGNVTTIGSQVYNQTAALTAGGASYTTTANGGFAVTNSSATLALSSAATSISTGSGAISVAGAINGTSTALTTTSNGSTSFSSPANLLSLSTNGAGLGSFASVTTSAAAGQTYNNLAGVTLNGATYNTGTAKFIVGTPTSAVTANFTNSATAITTGPGMISFWGTISGSMTALTTNSTGTTVFHAPILSLSSLTTTGTGGATTLSGGSITTSSTQAFNNAVVLTANTALTTTGSGGSIAFGSTVNGAFALTTNSGTTSFSSSVTGLARLSITGATTIAGAAPITINTVGNGQGYIGPVTLNVSSTTFSATGGGAITFDAPVAGAAGDSLTVSAFNIDIDGGSIITTGGGSQTYNGIVTLGAALTISTSTTAASTPAGSVSFNNPIAASITGAVLTINAEASGSGSAGGAVTLVGTSSTGPTLGGLSVNTTGTTSSGIVSLGGTFTTSGPQTFDGPVTLTAATTIVSSTPAGGNITFDSTLGGTQRLTLLTDGTVALDGAVGGTVGGTTQLTSLLIQGNSTPATGTTDLGAGTVITSGTQSYNNAVVLTSSATLDSISSGQIGFAATVNAAESGTQSLSVNTAGNIVFGGQVGATPFSTITTDDPTSGVSGLPGLATQFDFVGTSAAPSVTTLGNQTYNNAVLLGTDTVLDVSGRGNLAFQSTVDGTTAFRQALSTDVNGITTFAANVGVTTPLASLGATTFGPFALGSAGPTFPFQAIVTGGSISVTVNDPQGAIATNDSLAINPNVELDAANGSVSMSAGYLISAGAGTLIEAPHGTVNFTTGYGEIPTGGTILGGSMLLDDTWGGDIVSNEVVVTGQNSGNATSTTPLNAMTFIVQSASGGSPAPDAISVDAASQTVSNYGAPILTYSGIEDIALEPLEVTATTYNLNLYAMQGNHSLVVEGPILETVPSGAPAATPTALNPVFFVTAPEDFNELQMYAGDGNDLLENLTNIASLLSGGPGDDTLVGGSNVNVFFGGSGTESIYGGNGTFFTSASEPKFVNYIFADYTLTPGQAYNPNSAPANPAFVPAVLANISVQNGHNLIESVGPGTITGTTSADTKITSRTAAAPFLIDAESALEPPSSNTLAFTLPAPPFMLQNGTLTVTGTSGNDSIGVVFSSPTNFSVTVGNASSQAFSTSTVKSIVIDAAGGVDTASVTLPADSTVAMSPDLANISTSNFSLSILQSSSIYLIGNSSSTATVNVAGGATVSMSPTFVSLSLDGTPAGFLTGFSSVTANSYGDGDVAYLYGATGVTNTLTATPTSATISGTGYSNTAAGFHSVIAVAASNNDTATLGDTVSDPGTYLAALQAAPVAAFFGSDFDNQLFGFKNVTANATAGSETAILSDATGGGVYTGSATSGTATDAALAETYAVTNFKQVFFNGQLG